MCTFILCEIEDDLWHRGPILFFVNCVLTLFSISFLLHNFTQVYHEIYAVQPVTWHIDSEAWNANQYWLSNKGFTDSCFDFAREPYSHSKNRKAVFQLR